MNAFKASQRQCYVNVCSCMCFLYDNTIVWFFIYLIDKHQGLTMNKI